MLATIRGRIDDVRTLRRLFEDAEEVAGRDGLVVPGPEHVVVAAIGLSDDDSAAAAIAAAGLDPDDLEAAIRRTHAAALGMTVEDDGPVESPPVPRSTPYRMTGAGEAFVRAVHDAHRETGGRLRGAHVVLAAADLHAGVWPRVLAAASVDPDLLRASAVASLG